LHIDHSATANGKPPSRDPIFQLTPWHAAEPQECFLDRILGRFEVASQPPRGVSQQGPLVTFDDLVQPARRIIREVTGVHETNPSHKQNVKQTAAWRSAFPNALTRYRTAPAGTGRAVA
jgi:hypothetical protein